jgi:redox-sensitive bicupin YhaK (pirin superfamily)
MGNGSVIRPGDVQRMSAGTGVMHSEFNHSKDEPVHLLQIWIMPDKRGVTPSYEERNFPEEERRGQLRLIASPDGTGGSVTINQDALVYATILNDGESITHQVGQDRHIWIQVAGGIVTVNGQELVHGDGAAISKTSEITITSNHDSELLLFDLA